MILDGFFIGRQIHAIHLVFRDIAVQPLNLRADVSQSLQGAQRDFPNLGFANEPAPGISRSITNCGIRALVYTNGGCRRLRALATEPRIDLKIHEGIAVVDLDVEHAQRHESENA